MSPTLGFASLLLLFSINIFLPFFNFFSLRKLTDGEKLKKIFELQKAGFFLSALSFCCAVFSQICLIYSFIISDYSVLNVYQNSHHLKPLIYKISGSWGNHEGSMLLLISILCAYSFAFNFFSKIDEEKKLLINSSQSFIIALITAFAAFASNPFTRIFPTPKSGLGLNPLLQDIGLALHPPMLYTGYIGFSLIFSFAVAALLSEKIDQKFAKYLQTWLFISWGFLTLGIGLGAWWAYRELGWGGYWFWDPVENVSLMPWLAATILIHCVKLLEKKEIFKIWTIFLSILTFILCLLGIFLVRSGILTSVHSFAIDAKRGFFVIALIAIIGGGALLIFGMKILKIKNRQIANSPLVEGSLKNLILLNNYFLIIALFVVLLGTLYPIFLRSFFDQFISIGPSYYNQIFSILIIPFLIFLAVASKTTYRHNVLILLTSSAITSLTFFYRAEVNFLQIIILFLAIFAALRTIFSCLIYKNPTMFFAHFGFSLIIIGIVLSSSFSLTKEVNLKQSEVLKIANFDLKFNQVEYFAGENFLTRQGDFTILKNEKKIGKLSPQLRYYPVSNQSTNEASIQHGFFGDLYLVIGNKDENENYALRVYYKPFIYLIWLGCTLIFLSAILKVFRKKI